MVVLCSLFQYTPCNIPGPGTDPEAFAEQYAGCGCPGDDCRLSACTCTGKYGCSYDTNHRLALKKPASAYTSPILECNRDCKCGLTCCNRLVQNGIRCRLQVFHDSKKGLSLQSLEDIPSGTFVCEYAGEVLTYEEAKKRTKNLKSDESNYIIVLRESYGNGVHCIYVDPTYRGNIGRFINHSCDPNLVMLPVRVNNNIPKLALFAFRDIKTGEELCYSYSGTVANMDSNISGSGKIDFQDSFDRKPCFCGSVNCCGYLPCDMSLYSS